MDQLPTDHDLSSVCTLLPRLPSHIQMIPMKLKRKLGNKGHYMYQQYVRPEKVLAALKLLKLNNPLCKDSETNSDRLNNDAAQDYSEFWEALTASLSTTTILDRVVGSTSTQRIK